MDEDRGILVGGLILLALAIALLAVWRVWIYKPASPIHSLYDSKSTNSYFAQNADPETLSQKIRRQELMAAPDFSLSSPEDLGRTNKFVITDPSTVSAVKKETAAPAWKKYLGQPAPLPHSTSYSGMSNGAYPTTTTTGNQTPIPLSTYTHFSQPSSLGDSQELNTVREQILAPYLLPKPEAQTKLNNNLRNLSNSIALALQRFLTPKSKKETNIEKYLHKTEQTSPSAGLEDPFQEMMVQINNQKNEIVQNVTQAFGAQAGQRAGALMSDFQRDLSSEISKTDQAPQTTVQNIQKITKNYQQKFEKMNQENQYNQYVENLTQDYNKQLQDLQEIYPGNPDLQQELARIYQEYLSKDLSLSSQNLTSQEYSTAKYENHYALQKEAQEAVKKLGGSVNDLLKYEQDQEKQKWREQQQLEEEGKIISVPRKMSETDTAGLSTTLEKEQNDKLNEFTQYFGEETAATVRPILQNYYQQMMQTAREEMTDTDRMRQQALLRLEANRKILDVQIAAVERMNIPQDQKEQTLQSLEKEQIALQDMLRELQQQMAAANR